MKNSLSPDQKKIIFSHEDEVILEIPIKDFTPEKYPLAPVRRTN